MVGMTNKKYVINLTPEQREELTQITRNGNAPTKKISHARILLMSDQHHTEGRWTDQAIKKALGIHINTIARIRKRFILQGQQPALNRKQRTTPARETIFDGAKEAQLIAICCQEAPQGYARWSLSLLVTEAKKRGIVTQVCRETVRQTLKKMNYNLGVNNATASPKKMPLDSALKWKKSSKSTRVHTTI
jgi:transposase